MSEQSLGGVYVSSECYSNHLPAFMYLRSATPIICQHLCTLSYTNYDLVILIRSRNDEPIIIQYDVKSFTTSLGIFISLGNVLSS